MKAYASGGGSGGTGDVAGPASATDNAIARFDGAGGKTLQNSGLTISDTNVIGSSTDTVVVGVSNGTDTGYLEVIRADIAGRYIRIGPSIGGINQISSSGDFSMSQGGSGGLRILPGGTEVAYFTFAAGAISAGLYTRRPTGPEITSPETVAITDSGKCITNEGAGGAVTYNLPAAAAGLEYIFIVQATQNMAVTAAGGDTIRIAAGVSSAGGTATNGTIGSSLHLLAINGTEWMAVAAPNGTWTLA